VKILILGASGMLGKDLSGILSARNEVVEKDIGDLDIADAKEVHEAIGNIRPQVVINAAAYTDVDGCESNHKLAFSVNAEGAGNVARGCASAGVKMVHFSTDYVFDGSSRAPYREEDTPNPLSVYGESKLRGERLIQEVLKDHLIIRTEWLYGRNGKNFVDTILKQASQQKELRVVDDQWGAPTFTKDLAKAVEVLLLHPITGIIHVTNSGSCTWFQLAKKILDIKKLTHIQARPITSKDLNRPARRPENSVLDCSKFERISGQKMRLWEQALDEYLCKN
jgi:dTDP-4-dehydrorhamnose reductase